MYLNGLCRGHAISPITKVLEPATELAMLMAVDCRCKAECSRRPAVPHKESSLKRQKTLFQRWAVCYSKRKECQEWCQQQGRDFATFAVQGQSAELASGG